MRKINQIIIHCADTPATMDVGVAEIRNWHKQRGWSDIGYHYVIRRNGVIEDGRPVERIGAHTRGHNRDSIGICLVGGMEGFNFTHAQMDKLSSFIFMLCVQHGLKFTDVHGHNEYSTKRCPFFNVKEYFRFDR